MFERCGCRMFAACLVSLVAVLLNCPGARSQESSTPAVAQPAAAALAAKPDGSLRFTRSFDSNDAGRPATRKTDDRAAATDGGAGAGQPHQQALTELTPGGKMRRAFRKAFLSPEGYLRSGISAAITQATEEDQPHKTTGDKFADGLSRFAIKTGTRSTRTVLGSGVFPVLFRQDPRYDRSVKKGVGARALHAVSRVFVARSDDGRLQPNYSRWAGSLSSSALSNLWERSTPGHDRIGVDATFRRFGSSLIGDAWQILLFNEFGPDIFRVFRR